MDKYLLDENNNPYMVHSMEVWIKGWKEQREIKKTYIGNTLVSTIFLGFDHAFLGGNRPILFKTMVFFTDDPKDEQEHQWRYATWDEAIEHHDEIVDTIQSTGMTRKVGFI